MTEATEYGQLLRGCYETNISGRLLTFSIYWARAVDGEGESLLTSNTKHTFYELQYVLDGHVDMQINDKIIPVKESEWIVIPPDTFHQITHADDAGMRFIMAFSVSAEDPELTCAIKALEDLTPRCETAFLRGLLHLLLDDSCAALHSATNSLMIESLLLELLSIVLPSDRFGESSSMRQTENQKRVGEILDFIKIRHGIDLSVSMLARQFALSERHLNRIFRAETQQTLKDFINHEKLKRIEELTASTSLTLNEISELCGFCDEYGMNKFFRRFNLINLSEYRKIAKR